MTGARVLVVEDEPLIRRGLSRGLDGCGFDVRSCAGGAEALEAAAAFAPHVVLLDVGLPDIDGFTVAQRLAGTPAAIVFLTARADQESTLRGLRAGDDYVTKPFVFEEVVARIATITRRRPQLAPGVLELGDLELDEGEHVVRRNGVEVPLTATELRLLGVLMHHPRQILSRAQLLELVWGQEAVDTRVVETYISYLRRKLGTPNVIHTARGIGYVLRPVRPRFSQVRHAPRTRERPIL